MTEYVRPNSLRDALAVVNENTVAVAGATDIYPAQSSRGAWGQRSDKVWVDISALAELKGMTQSPTHWRIGALTTWSELIDARLPRCFDALVAAAHEVGGKQIQNRATIGGNLCNASPAADGIPPLLCLNAEIEMCSAKGARTLPLIKFIRGNRQTALADNELVTAILLWFQLLYRPMNALASRIFVFQSVHAQRWRKGSRAWRQRWLAVRWMVILALG